MSSINRCIKINREIFENDDAVANQLCLHYIVEEIKKALGDNFHVEPEGVTKCVIEISILNNVPAYIRDDGTAEYDPEFVHGHLRVKVEVVE